MRHGFSLDDSGEVCYRPGAVRPDPPRMQTPRVHSWLTRASVAAVLITLIGAGEVHAAKRKPPAAPPPPPVLRFPDSPSDTLISELTQAGRVTGTLPPEPEDWRRWG